MTVRPCLGYPGYRCPQLIPLSGSRCVECQQAVWRHRQHTRPQGPIRLYATTEWRHLAAAVVGSALECHWCHTSREHCQLSADHIESVATRPDLGLVVDNVVAACRSCQIRRQRRPDVSTWQAWEREPRVPRW